MRYRPENPLIVQSDRTLLLEVQNPDFEVCRQSIGLFADIEKSPEHIHTYRITPLSIWNARAAGLMPGAMLETLERFSKFEIPPSLAKEIEDLAARYGRLKLHRDRDRLLLRSDSVALIEEIWNHRRARAMVRSRPEPSCLEVPVLNRGRIKQILLKLGWPVEDLAGYSPGAPLALQLRDITRSGLPFSLRRYQLGAAESFWMEGSDRGGSGVLVLPCGAGKTVIGLAAMEKAQARTLILVTGVNAARQWRREILDKTNLPEDAVAEYSGECKQIAPVTIATYQVMTHRRAGKGGGAGDEDDLSVYPHLALFSAEDWGLIIYDEVHLLPAPVFRMTAEIQARRRLGLTATLVREDGREDDVFSLIGPKRYDVPWRELESQGWIAEALCTEVRLALSEEQRMEYAVAERREKYRIASTIVEKQYVVDRLIRRHEQDHVLVIGQYLDQLEAIAARHDAPLITGKVPSAHRERLYQAFRDGEIRLLVVSKVANFAIDLPDANVAIQVSGTFGSRQEEAQRLGRILRPKDHDRPVRFYTIVTRDTVDQEFALHRQLYLTEQGYRYEIVDAASMVSEDEVNRVASRLIG